MALNGRASNEKQKYRCKTCKKQSLENPTPHAWLPKNAQKKFSEPLKVEAVCEGSSGHSEYHGLKSNSWKKRPHSCQCFRETLIPPDASDAEATVLELDEEDESGVDLDSPM